MELIGWWVAGSGIAVASSKPIRTAEDFKDWKFRSPPGMETKIFEKLGAIADRDGLHRDLHRA